MCLVQSKNALRNYNWKLIFLFQTLPVIMTVKCIEFFFDVIFGGERHRVVIFNWWSPPKLWGLNTWLYKICKKRKPLERCFCFQISIYLASSPFFPNYRMHSLIPFCSIFSPLLVFRNMPFAMILFQLLNSSFYILVVFWLSFT